MQTLSSSVAGGVVGAVAAIIVGVVDIFLIARGVT